ncbi:NUDIX hydrolase [Nonomuraea jiangxiensis]|uniref:8-oxo-dGTP diphosphatase n=1 Tax=Nonomuraea jiangxiensis TaxID=633440 RepID=A0A1G8LSR4_9ACTN|nr:NUDIX hydrolase [Nonomuraea jiangxiensis]SDI58734.1 8-oxo-dGTP diphosphatase [Nonomuraea jiangxiensis]
MTHVIATRTVPWIPVAHRLDLILSPTLPPVDQITSAFAFVSDETGRTLLTCIDREGRGWDIPGGHLEPGETPPEAAARELYEETGLRLTSSDLSVFAWERIELHEPPPADYRYAALTYMVMFRARLPRPGAPTRPPAGSESTHAEWLSYADISRLCAGRSWLALLDGARPL